MEGMNENTKPIKEQEYFWDYIKKLVQLRGDIDTKGIKEAIYSDMIFRGPIVWVLACSIIIASIGLNVSSTAVVIGAMLISPLMSPIVGIGLSVGTYNWPKLVSALRNFGVMVVISLISSYLYFLLSPLKEPSAEIIARTQPTLLDVIIAFVGGMAGIIAITRKNMSNVIPGVAIATALMPPLCTAGYGLANLNFTFFWGGFYLFILNSIMIALATYIIVTYLRFPNFKYVDAANAKKLKRYISIFIIAIMLPSIYIFYGLVKSSTFTRSADLFVDEVKDIDGKRLMKHFISYGSDSSTIELVYMDVTINDSLKIEAKAKEYNFANTKILIVDASKSTNERLSEILDSRNKEEKLKSLEENTNILSNQLKKSQDSLLALSNELSKYNGMRVPFEDFEKEVKSIFPKIKRLAIANIVNDSKTTLNQVPCLFVSWDGRRSNADMEKLKKYARTRLKEEKLLVNEF